MENNGNKRLREQIIEYWDNARLCSFDSSTSHADCHLASCDNFIESKLLDMMLINNTTDYNKCNLGLDIGAGFGRFTVVMARHLDLVHALEPAENLFYKLKDNCSKFDNIKIFNNDFESFNVQNNYDISIVSGLLYFYPNDMVHKFLKKLVESLNEGGVILVRDFVVKEGVKRIPSSYIEGNFCYYRDTKYWDNLAQEYDLNLLSIFQSRPSYRFKKLVWLINKLHLMKLFQLQIIQYTLYKILNLYRQKGVLNFSGSEIKTVFMVMKKK